MKTTAHLLIFALAACPLFGEENNLVSELLFPDGDALLGHPTGVTKEGFLLWDSPLLLKDSNPFKINQLDSIQWLSPQSTQSTQSSDTVATLTFHQHTDGIHDVIQANLLGFDDQSVSLKTWYAGELTLKRSMVHLIEVSTKAPAIINGVGRIADWQRIEKTNAWTIDGDNLISKSRGSIARNLPKLPDKIHLEFRIDFESYSPFLRMILFADSGNKSDPDTGYSISIQRGTMQFLKKDKRTRIHLKNALIAQGHNFKEENFTKVEIFLDRTQGKLYLYLDGDMLCSATDPEPLLDHHWLHLAASRSHKQTISQFAIRPWDGELPQSLDYLNFRQKLPIQGEHIELQNGDTIVGKASAITEGKLQIETEFIPISIPVERLSSFQITSKEAREEPRLYPEDVRAYFHHGGHVTLRLEELTATTITGYSQVFGTATFALTAFTHIEFNPYELEFRERRGQPF